MTAFPLYVNHENTLNQYTQVWKACQNAPLEDMVATDMARPY